MDAEFERWLNAHDVALWRETIRNGWARGYCLFALEETGVTSLMRRIAPERRSAAELAAECKIDAGLLDALLTYMALSDIVIDKVDEKYALTPRGVEWLADPRTHQLLYTVVGSYSIMMHEMVPALRGEKQYGKDFVRRGDYLAMGTRASSDEYSKWTVGELRALGAKTVADLACGSAHIPIAFCKLDPDLRGVGIDIAPGAVAEATKKVAEAGLSDRIRIMQGDITRPETYAKELGEAQVFTCIGAIHEFLRNGEEAVVDILRRMKAMFPGKHMFIGEYNAPTDDEFRERPIPARIRGLYYQHLMHPFSLQGMPVPRARWLGMFDRAGVEVVKIKDFHLDQYLLRF